MRRMRPHLPHPPSLSRSAATCPPDQDIGACAQPVLFHLFHTAAITPTPPLSPTPTHTHFSTICPPPCPPLRPLQVLARVHSAGGDDSPTRSAGEAFRDCRLDGVLYTGADGGYGGDLPATGKLKLTYVCHKPLDEISCKARAAEANFNLN